MTDREAFEAWAKDKPNMHVSYVKSTAFEAWQAALAAERKKQAQQVISDSWQEMERAKQAEPNLIPVDFDTDDWIESRGENMVTCHSRTVGGVLCRYWGENVPRGRALIDAAAASQQSAEPVASDNYVQPVPDHCDRITWRGQYFHLPLAAPPAVQQAEPDVGVLEMNDLERAVASFGAAMLGLGFCSKERRAEMRAWKDEAYKAVIEAATPAVQAEPVATAIKTAVTNEWLFNECFDKYPTGIYQLYAAPPADDEAVRLLSEAANNLRSAVCAFERNDALDWDEPAELADAIDAYLARVKR